MAMRLTACLTRGEDTRNAAQIAAMNGHIEILQMLVDHGVDVNETDNAGYTPLDYVVGTESKELHQQIVKLGGKHGATFMEEEG